MAEMTSVFTRSKSLNDLNNREEIGSEDARKFITRALLAKKLPHDLQCLKDPLIKGKDVDLQRLEEKINQVSGETIKANEGIWKEAAEVVNAYDGRLTIIMLEKMKTYIQNVVDSTICQNAERNRMPTDENQSNEEVTLPVQALLASGYPLNVIEKAKEVLRKQGKDPDTATAVEYFDIIHVDGMTEDQTTAYATRYVFRCNSCGSDLELCDYCGVTLSGCQGGCRQRLTVHKD